MVPAERATEEWIGHAANSPQPLQDLVTRYLSPSHCDDQGDGCLFAALATDAARRSEPVRAAFADALKSFAAHVAGIMPSRSEACRREAALAAIATMIGAVAMARAADGDPFADEVLSAARATILGKDDAA